MRLSDAFDLGSGEIVAIVGGGGKTTAMYRLARETAAEGGAAIATGTTLFTPPSDRPRHLTVIAEREDELTDAVRAALERERCIIVATGHGTQGRLLPVAAGAPAAMLALRGVRRVIVEADGSRTRGFKAPGDHEPVIPDGATIVVAVAGMSALGQPLDAEHVHRPERVEALTGVSPGVLVTVEMMAAVLAHPLGGRKGVPDGARFAVLLNQVDARRIGDARLLGALLRDAGVECVVLAQAREDPPVVDVLR